MGYKYTAVFNGLDALKFMIKSWQMKLIFIVGVVCVAIVFAIDVRGIACLIDFLISFAIINLGNWIYIEDTSENWLRFRLSDTAKSVIGSILVLIGGVLFLRNVLALAIAALILRFG
jgi:hypothetical protein